jgi:hypothetical protein
VFDPRETPKVVALAAISLSENLEKERFDLVPGVRAWKRFLASCVARSNCVASPLGYILTLWLERIGDVIFSLIPPNAMTSSSLLDCVDGEKGAAAICGEELTSVARFSH